MRRVLLLKEKGLLCSRPCENEYYLNSDKCRLKDITDLFLDSKSSKESFNIVPQNKIDQILSEKPEERRIIFEDAAGVLKYKKRKEESLSKLSKTHENIDRINLIINMNISSYFFISDFIILFFHCTSTNFLSFLLF